MGTQQAIPSSRKTLLPPLWRSSPSSILVVGLIWGIIGAFLLLAACLAPHTTPWLVILLGVLILGVSSALVIAACRIIAEHREIRSRGRTVLGRVVAFKTHHMARSFVPAVTLEYTYPRLEGGPPHHGTSKALSRKQMERWRCGNSITVQVDPHSPDISLPDLDSLPEAEGGNPSTSPSDAQQSRAINAYMGGFATTYLFLGLFVGAVWLVGVAADFLHPHSPHSSRQDNVVSLVFLAGSLSLFALSWWSRRKMR